MVLGLVLSVAGLAAATWAAYRLWSPTGRRPGLALPLGALVVASLPPFWDFSTSGLETGLTFLWLGGTFMGLVSLADGPRADRGALVDGLRSPLTLAVAIGLGPLVRPDLALFALGFLALLVVLERPGSVGRAAVLVGLAAVIPVGYQVFRMGYFASLVPNTALAKEAGVSSWERGWEYLSNFAGPYALWLPLAVLAGWAVFAATSLWRRGERRRTLLVALPIALGLLHALYIVRLGGDYMHARVLLPSVFAILLPVAVVVPPRRWAVPLAVVIVPWAAFCATSLRAPAKLPADLQQLQVNDQRRQYAEVWGYRHPVTLDDLLAVPDRRLAVQRRQGLELARLAERSRAIVLSFPGPRNAVGERLKIPEPLVRAVPRANVESEVVAWHGSIGRVGYAAGPNVRLVDPNGLADPIASRTRLPAFRPTRPGHEKHLPRDWVLARYAAPASPVGAASLERDPGVVAARRALRCRPLADLVKGTTGKLSTRRFFANMAYAVRERSLRFDRDPRVAVRELCRRR